MSTYAKQRGIIRIASSTSKYYWQVAEHRRSGKCALYVNSRDKDFRIRYAFDQEGDWRCITVIEAEFKTDLSRYCVHYRCPTWEEDGGVITADQIRALIDWAMDPGKKLVEVDRWGNPVPLGGKCDSCGLDLHGKLWPFSTNCCFCGHLIAERAE